MPSSWLPGAPLADRSNNYQETLASPGGPRIRKLETKVRKLKHELEEATQKLLAAPVDRTQELLNEIQDLKIQIEVLTADNEALQADYQQAQEGWEAQTEANDELQQQLNALKEEEAEDALRGQIAADPLESQRSSTTASGLFHVVY